MNNKKNKIAIGVMCLMLVSMFSLVIAQCSDDIVVVLGETTEGDMIHLDEGPSISYGAIVTQIQSEFRRYVQYGGVNVYLEEVIDSVNDFDVYMFPADAATGFDSLSTGDLFQTSEEVEVRGITSTWETYNATAIIEGGVDTQSLSGFGVQMTYDDGKWLNVVSSTGATIVVNTYDGGNEKIMTDIDMIIATGTDCPSDEQLLSEFGIVAVAKRQQTLGEVGGQLLCQIEEPAGTYRYLIDMNGDAEWDFSTSIEGYTVTSDSGQSLAILPENIYDIFGIVA